MKLRSLIKRLQDYIQRLKKRPLISFGIKVAIALGEDGAGDMAGSIAYYAFLSVFPLLLGVISLLGLVLPAQTIQAQISTFIEEYLPGSSQFIQQNVINIINLRGPLGIVALIGLFWTGSAIFGAIGRIINRAWNIRVYRPYYIRKTRDVLLAAGTSIIFLLSMGTSAFASLIPVLDLPVLNLLGVIVTRLISLTLMFAAFLLMYKFMPNTRTSWQHVWPSAVLAAVLFEIARLAFLYYLTNYANFTLIYGSLAVVIVLLVWIYISAFIIILGAEFSSEYVKWHENSNKGKKGT